MTGREAEIYKILQTDPMISQNDIALQLGITRSAVSVYLNNMIKKGILRGRGYLLNEADYPVLIGPGHIDIRSYCEEEQFTTSMVGTGLYCKRTDVTYGGTIKNVASYLTRLECKPHAIFSVGSDFLGSQFLQNCNECGINVEDSLVVPESITPIYNEILTVKGRVTYAYMKENLADRLSPAFLQTKQRSLRGANEVVIHDSLTVETAEYLLSTCSDSYTIFFSVMYPDTMKFLELLPRFKLVVFPLSVLLNIAFPDGGVDSENYSVNDLRKACCHMRELGVKNLLISCTPSQIFYMRKDSFLLHNAQIPDLYRNKEPYTHRDAFVAGVVYCHENGIALDASLDFLAAAKLVAMESKTMFDTHFSLARVEAASREIDSETKLYRY